MQFLARNFLLKRSIKPPKSQILPPFWLFWHKSSKSSYNLHWHFDKKSCFVVVLVLKDWISTVQSNFLSQKLSVECNFFSNELFLHFSRFSHFSWEIDLFSRFLARNEKCEKIPGIVCIQVHSTFTLVLAIQRLLLLGIN